MASKSVFGSIGNGRRRAHLIALEPRMMFDAAAAATTEKVIAAAAHDGDNAALSAALTHLATDVARPTAEAAPHAVIFIDTAVADYKQLASEWAGQGEVVLIDSRSDGIAQMQAALAGETNVSAIHIVSHGEEGAFYLGTTRIDQTAIEGALAGSLAAIGKSLEPGGDILIYGCDFAEGADGQRALDAFAHATGADVAASTDLTGAADLGGNWTLEAHDGAIEARTLDAYDWHHTLVANTIVPIAVQPGSLTVIYNNQTVGYGNDGRTTDVGAGAVATWAGAATAPDGTSLDLVARVVSISQGDTVRFTNPVAGSNGDDATFLLRDNSAGSGDANVQIEWSLVDSTTHAAVPANIEFTIGDIDGIGGATFSRETVSTSTAGLAYFTHQDGSDVKFISTLDTVTASGTQNENPVAGQPIDPKSDATFDWTNVSTFTLSYTLTTNSTAQQAQFFQDGNAQLVKTYTQPVYTSIPRLDLDADDSTIQGAAGVGAGPNDAHFAYTENGAPLSVVDSDVVVTNPMDVNSITGATVILTNAKAGDVLSIADSMPANVHSTITTGNGMITVTLTGAGSESDYEAALRAVQFSSTSDNPDTTQRVIDVNFSNDILTSATAVSRIDVFRTNDPPNTVGTLPAQAASDHDTVTYETAGGFADVDGDTLTYRAAGLPDGLSIDASSGEITGTLGRSASQINGGRYTITVTATDPSDTSATQSFVLTVTNPPPVAADDTATTAEDTPVLIDVLHNDSDPDGDTITVTAASALHGQVVINSDNTLTYTPSADYNGQDTISYTITDADHATASAHVAVTITPVNDAPRPTNIPQNYNLQDGQIVNAPAAGAFYDPDGDALTYTATGLPAGLTINRNSGVISGTVDRSASQVNGGVYDVVLTATDPSGLSATQHATVHVTNPPPTAANDSATTAEDTPVVIDVLANDTDPDHDPLTVTAASAQHGRVIINPDNTLTYTPSADYNGPDTIAYTISDGQGGTSGASVAVTVTPVNDAPVAVGALLERSTLDGTAVSWATADHFRDVDGDTLTYSATGLPAGLSIDPATGVISGTIDRSASQAGGGHYAPVVTATDPSGLSATQRFTIDVANPAPTASDDSATTHVDTPVTIAPLANDSDPDGDPLTVTSASAGHGTVAINPDGTITYTPTAGFAGTDTIAYAISDGNGGAAHAVVTVTVTNTPPATRPVGTQNAQDGAAVALPLAAFFADADGDALRYSATGLPPGLAIDPATGTISGTIDRSASLAPGNAYDTIVTASDGHGGTASQTVHWIVTDPAPTARDDAATTNEGQPVVIAPLANDSDPDGDPLTIVAAGAGHGTVAINDDGTITYTPDAHYNGSDTILYTISDGQGGRSSSAIAVTIVPVNDAPVAAALPARADVDGMAVTLPLASAFSDADGDPLVYTATGLPAGLSIDPATGVISGTIAAGSASSGPAGDGHYPVIITATDPSGASGSATFDWAVGFAGPMARNDAAVTAEDTAVRIDALANDSDPDGLSFALSDASATHGSVAIVDGALVFTPDADFNGEAAVFYTVIDSAGHRASAVATITVTPVNDAPVARTIPALASADGDGGIDLAAGAYFFDVDGDTLAYTATGLPAGLAFDPSTGHITGTIDRAASQVDGGVYHVVLTATDPSGATATARFDWAISNPPPVAGDDRATVAEETATTIAVLGNDTDPDGDPLSIAGAQAAHGSVAINADGTLAYTPDANFTGTDLILYTLSDGNGGYATGRVVVTVTPVEHAPVAIDDTATTGADRPTDIAVLANDSDRDGDPLSVTDATATSGRVSINADGTLHYIPAAGFSGTDTIRYTIADGRGGTASALVTVTVTPDRAPVIAPRDPIPVAAGRPLTIDALAGVTDPDGDPVTVTAAQSAHGTVAINPDGTLLFTPARGFTGDATIVFTVSDGRGGIATGSIPVTVLAPRGADVQQLLALGTLGTPGNRPTIVLSAPDGIVRNPFTAAMAIDAIRSLDGTRDLSSATPVADAAEAARSLRGVTESDGTATGPVGAEVDRLERLADHRDAGDRLFDHRWDDIAAVPMTGFSTAGVAGAGVMMQTIVEGGAIYLDVRDTAPDRAAEVRSVDVRLADGSKPGWISVDPAGAAIIEAPLDADELHLVVTVTRRDGTQSRTPIVIQRATGEIEIDRKSAHPAHAARPLDATLHTPHAAAKAAAAHLARSFK